MDPEPESPAKEQDESDDEQADDGEEEEERDGDEEEKDTLLGSFMFGNVDDSGQLEGDFDDETNEILTSSISGLSGLLRGELGALGKGAKAAEAADETDYSQKRPDAVDYEDFDEAIEDEEGPAPVSGAESSQGGDNFSIVVSMSSQMSSQQQHGGDEDFDEDEEEPEAAQAAPAPAPAPAGSAPPAELPRGSVASFLPDQFEDFDEEPPKPAPAPSSAFPLSQASPPSPPHTEAFPGSQTPPATTPGASFPTSPPATSAPEPADAFGAADVDMYTVPASPDVALVQPPEPEKPPSPPKPSPPPAEAPKPAARPVFSFLPDQFDEVMEDSPRLPKTPAAKAPEAEEAAEAGAEEGEEGEEGEEEEEEEELDEEEQERMLASALVCEPKSTSFQTDSFQRFSELFVPKIPLDVPDSDARRDAAAQAAEVRPSDDDEDRFLSSMKIVTRTQEEREAEAGTATVTPLLARMGLRDERYAPRRTRDAYKGPVGIPLKESGSGSEQLVEMLGDDSEVLLSPAHNPLCTTAWEDRIVWSPPRAGLNEKEEDKEEKEEEGAEAPDASPAGPSHQQQKPKKPSRARLEAEPASLAEILPTRGLEDEEKDRRRPRDAWGYPPPKPPPDPRAVPLPVAEPAAAPSEKKKKRAARFAAMDALIGRGDLAADDWSRIPLLDEQRTLVPELANIILDMNDKRLNLKPILPPKPPGEAEKDAAGQKKPQKWTVKTLEAPPPDAIAAAIAAAAANASAGGAGAAPEAPAPAPAPVPATLARKLNLPKDRFDISNDEFYNSDIRRIRQRMALKPLQHHLAALRLQHTKVALSEQELLLLHRPRSHFPPGVTQKITSYKSADRGASRPSSPTEGDGDEGLTEAPVEPAAGPSDASAPVPPATTPRKIKKVTLVTPGSSAVGGSSGSGAADASADGGSGGPVASSSSGAAREGEAGAHGSKKKHGKGGITARTGKLVAFEYMDENPMLLMNPGMASRLLHLYRKRSGTDPHQPPAHDGGEPFVLEEGEEPPFIANVHAGETLSCAESTLFKAPAFRHPRPTVDNDFLLVRSKDGNGFVIREMPAIYVVGQEEPSVEVLAPNTREASKESRDRVAVWIMRALLEQGSLDYTAGSHGLSRIPISTILQQFPMHNDQTLRRMAKEHDMIVENGFVQLRRYRTEEEIRGLFTPEKLAAFESMQAGVARLNAAGIVIRSTLGLAAALSQLEEKEGDRYRPGIRFVEQEMMLTPWVLSHDFLEATRKNVPMTVTGLGDPSGRGFNVSFIRAPQKAAPDKKGKDGKDAKDAKDGKENEKPKALVTGTDADLRKLSQAEAKRIITKEFGVPEDQVPTARWRRIDLIRKLSSEVAAAGGESEFNKFARGTRATMAFQLVQSKEQIQKIFDKAKAALAARDEDDEEEDLDEFAEQIEQSLEGELEAALDDAFAEAGPSEKPKAGAGPKPGRLAAAVRGEPSQPPKGRKGKNEEEEQERAELEALLKEQKEREAQAAGAGPAAAAGRPAEPSAGACLPRALPLHFPLTSAFFYHIEALFSDSDAESAAGDGAAAAAAAAAAGAEAESSGGESGSDGEEDGPPPPPGAKRKVLIIRRPIVNPDGSTTMVEERVTDPGKISQFLEQFEEGRLRKRGAAMTVEEEIKRQEVKEAKKMERYRAQGRPIICTKCGSNTHLKGSRKCPRFAGEGGPVTLEGSKIKINPAAIRQPAPPSSSKRKREDELSGAKKAKPSNNPEALAFGKKLSEAVAGIRALPGATAFNKPVDTKSVPHLRRSRLFPSPGSTSLTPPAAFKDYRRYVSRPIDLSTIQRKCDQGQYMSTDEFLADIALMVDNCRKYCETRYPDVYKCALYIQSAMIDEISKRALDNFTVLGGSDPMQLDSDDDF
eukprot:tig00020903_g15088.t1